MSVEPLDLVEPEDDDGGEVRERSRNRLNSIVAVTVALLATVMGLCQVKADNIAQAMQQAQAKSIDTWAWYQAKKTRLLFAEATVDNFRVQALTASPAARATIQEKVAKYQAEVDEQTRELVDKENEARGFDATYEKLNFRDDQFDQSEALLALAISLLAITALTQKPWLYGVAMVPTAFGVLMGLAGLFGWGFHAGGLAKLLS